MTAIASYQDLRRAFVQRRRELGLTQEVANERAGLMGGYLSKIEVGIRNLGPISLPNTLAALDLDIVLKPKQEPKP